jgi:predicted nucleic acid-binding Zn ribbon protein
MTAPALPVAIGSLLDSCLDRAAGQPGAAAIWRVWEDAVGTQIARRAQPVRLRGRTLVVAVSSAPWMQELHLLKSAICGELNTRLASEVVSDLFFVLSEGGERAGTALEHGKPAPTCPPAPHAPDLARLPQELRQSFADLLAAWQRRAAS